MKELFLLRSASTKRFNFSISDYSNKLSHEGYLEAAAVGKYVYDQEMSFDKIYSSPAKRALHTTVLVKSVGGIDLATTYDERLYGAPVHRLLQIISSIEDRYNRVLIVGHNPGFELLVYQTLGVEIELSNASLIRIDMPIEEWKNVNDANCKLGFIIKPSFTMIRQLSVNEFDATQAAMSHL